MQARTAFALLLALASPQVAWGAWPPAGRPLEVAAGDQRAAAIATDGSGGAIVAWHDPTGLFARRVLASGELDPAWPANGRALSAVPVGAGRHHRRPHRRGNRGVGGRTQRHDVDGHRRAARPGFGRAGSDVAGGRTRAVRGRRRPGSPGDHLRFRRAARSSPGRTVAAAATRSTSTRSTCSTRATWPGPWTALPWSPCPGRSCFRR